MYYLVYSCIVQGRQGHFFQSSCILTVLFAVFAPGHCSFEICWRKKAFVSHVGAGLSEIQRSFAQERQCLTTKSGGMTNDWCNDSHPHSLTSTDLCCLSIRRLFAQAHADQSSVPFPLLILELTDLYMWWGRILIDMLKPEREAK